MSHYFHKVIFIPNELFADPKAFHCSQEILGSIADFKKALWHLSKFVE